MEAAQAVLAAFDTSLSRQWRDEDRRWRAEDRQWRADDLAFREEERRWFGEEAEMRSAEIRWEKGRGGVVGGREEGKRGEGGRGGGKRGETGGEGGVRVGDGQGEILWREEDMNQRHVDNARYLWARFVEKNRRDVEEKSEQLKAISNLAALFAGFAVVTLTQFQVTLEDSPMWNIALYGILTAISVCLHTVAMVQCTLIMGSILKNGKAYVDEEAEEHFMFRCLLFVRSFSLGDRPPAPRRTFEAFWEYRCEDDWRKAFNYFTWGIFSFLLSLIPIGWIKFNFSTFIPAAFTAIVICSMVLWAYQQLSWGVYLTKGHCLFSSTTKATQQANLLPTSSPLTHHHPPRAYQQLSWGAYLTKGRRQFDSLLSEAESFRVRPSSLPFDWHIAAVSLLPSPPHTLPPRAYQQLSCRAHLINQGPALSHPIIQPLTSSSRPSLPCTTPLSPRAYQQLSWGAYLTKGRRQFDSLLSEAEAFRVRPSGLPFDWHIAPEASRKRSSSRRSRSGREGGSSDAASTAFADGDGGPELKPGSGLENTDGKAPRTSASGSGNGNVKASEDGASGLGSSGEKVAQGQGGKKVEEKGERASMNGGLDSTCRARREPGQEDCLIGGDSGGGGGGGDSIDVGDSGLSLAGGGNVPRAAVASKTKKASSRVSSCEISEVQE
ncbi:unnamed protein product [Closterium sp. Naga37s-1]|nr:unnamed protein product [Closterium sp. Naga37s-1]